MKRRDFLLTGTTIGAGIVAANVSLGRSPQEDEEEEFTAEEVLQELMDGNRRFVSGKSKHPRTTEDWLKRLTKGQRPLATILACSDSRDLRN